jgi:hypothetical protein
MARLKGWRTIILNALIAAGMVALEIVQYADGVPWREVLPDQYALYVVIGVNVLNIVLRSITTTPVGRKG